jgi:hypothetical protein
MIGSVWGRSRQISALFGLLMHTREKASVTLMKRLGLRLGRRELSEGKWLSD